MAKLVKRVGMIFVKVAVTALIISIIYNLVNFWIVFTSLRTAIQPLLINVISNNYLTPEVAEAFTGDKNGVYDSVANINCVFTNIKNTSVKDISIENVAELTSRNDRNEGSVIPSLKIVLKMDTVIWTPIGPFYTTIDLPLEYRNIVCLRRYKE